MAPRPNLAHKDIEFGLQRIFLFKLLFSYQHVKMISHFFEKRKTDSNGPAFLQGNKWLSRESCLLLMRSHA